MRAILLLLSFWFSCSLLAGDFQAAISTRTVNPDPLLPVSGGVGPSQPTTRRQGDLTVRALVVQQGGTRIAIVSADFLGFPAWLGNQVRAAVKDIPPQNILISATHTHSAPDCYGFPDGKGGTSADANYLRWVCARMAEAINEAASQLQPATLKVATGEAQGQIAYNYYAEALFDPRCSVVQFVGTSGAPIATLVNYAIHPEVIGSERGICSPDMVGPLYDRIHARGGGVGIFLNGAQGGMITADNRREGGTEVGTYEECQRIGTLLADEALRIVATAPIIESPALFCKARIVRFPVDSPLMRELLKSLPASAAAQEDVIHTQINLVNLGPAQILTIPGEAMPNIGFYLKRKMRGQQNLLFGLTNDAFGYILSKEDYDSFKRYAYITRTSLGERTGDILLHEALQLVADSPTPASAR